MVLKTTELSHYAGMASSAGNAGDDDTAALVDAIITLKKACSCNGIIIAGRYLNNYRIIEIDNWLIWKLKI